MKIRSVQVLNYKSFRNSGEIAIPSSFTILTGQNNSGKTAFSQAVSLTIDERPHRSLSAAPTASTPSRGPSNVQLRVELSASEFYELASAHGNEFNLPKTPNAADETQIEAIRSTFAMGRIPLLLDYQPSGFAAAYLDIPWTRAQSQLAFQFAIPAEGNVPSLMRNSIGVRMDKTVPYMIASSLRSRIYFFKAERFNVGQYTIGEDPTLLPDASNLAQALNNLQTSNPSKYDELISHVGVIFPDVHYITIPPLGSGAGVARISVWPLPTSTQRSDLAIPLQESGTGLGQVLAILYVAISAVHPRSIVIDEPQSFLHPGAIRKLVGILQTNYQHHQYIVATHSPVVLASVLSPSIIHLRKTGDETKAQIIEPTDTFGLRALLADVGARLSDVFGADNILWVEGRTEESCFPIIINKISRRASIGTAVLGILNVGDLQGREASRIISIYNRLSKGSALIPPAVGFIFDQNGKSQNEQDDIGRMSHGSIRFLPRRMFENYLIHPKALASVMSNIPEFSTTPVAEEVINQWLRTNSKDDRYLTKADRDLEVFGEEWFGAVNGARILNDLFLHLSSSRFEYDKVEHGTAITTYLCNNEPKALLEVAQLVEALMDSSDERIGPGA